MGRFRDKYNQGTHGFETEQGTLRWILDLIYAHKNFRKRNPPLSYAGQRTVEYENFNEIFDIFTTKNNSYYLCYSDHDRLIYCRNVERLDWRAMKMREVD